MDSKNSMVDLRKLRGILNFQFQGIPWNSNSFGMFIPSLATVYFEFAVS